MDARSRTPEEIHAEIADLQLLVARAERCHDDPEARIALSVFRQLIQRRQRQLEELVGDSCA